MLPEMALVPSKDDIRQDMLVRRKVVSLPEREAAALEISRLFFELFPDIKGCIAGYYAVQGELSPMPLLAQAAMKERQTALPRTLNAKRMAFYTWRAGDALAVDACGIPSPAAGEEIVPGIVLMPLLAYDPAGHRLGYGKGYYDKLLSEKAFSDCFRLGLAYGWQQVGVLPVLAHDIPMQAVLTPQGLIRF